MTALLTKREAASLCQVSVRTLERFIMPELPVVRIGSSVRIRPEDLNQWLVQHRDTSSAVSTEPASGTSAGPTSAPANAGMSRSGLETLRKRLESRRVSASQSSTSR